MTLHNILLAIISFVIGFAVYPLWDVIERKMGWGVYSNRPIS